MRYIQHRKRTVFGSKVWDEVCMVDIVGGEDVDVGRWTLDVGRGIPVAVRVKGR